MANNAELLDRVKQGDDAAADELVNSNMGLVYSVVSKFMNRRCETEDLMQIGAVGLIKAVRKFDTSFGVQFSTYAVPMIIGEIKRFLRDDGVIKVSRTLKENAAKGRRAEEHLSVKLGRAPKLSEISAECGISEEDLSAAFEASVAPESLQAGFGGDSEESGMRRLDRLVSEDTEDKMIDKVFIKESLKQLNDRERNIIIMRYFRGKTQSEIASLVGVSQVQISRIEKKALQRMREAAV